MKQSSKKRSSFLAFLSALCSGKPIRECDNSNNNKKCKMNLSKVPRLTFQLDRVLVKVSRKNVAQQQFMENQVLTYHLQKYLAYRFKQCDIIIFSGQFSNFLIEKIPYSLQLKSLKQEAYEKQNNYVLSNHIGQMKLKFDSVDALVFQLYFGENQTPLEKTDNPTKNQLIRSQVNSNIDKIEQILRYNQKKIKNFVFICHKNLKLQDIHNLFLVFKENYLFQFEKVKKIEKTVCNIVYVSTDTKFLRIDNSSLCQFIMCQFDRMRAFGEQKKYSQQTIETIQQKGFDEGEKGSMDKLQFQKKKQYLKKASFSREVTKRQNFHSLIVKILENNLHLKVSQVLATVLQFSSIHMDKLSWFLELMHEKYPQSRDLIDSYRLNPYEDKQEQVNKTNSEFTPMFVQKSKDQNNYSKLTALFDTQIGRDDDLLIMFSHEQNEENEYSQQKDN